MWLARAQPSIPACQPMSRLSSCRAAHELRWPVLARPTRPELQAPRLWPAAPVAPACAACCGAGTGAGRRRGLRHRWQRRGHGGRNGGRERTAPGSRWLAVASGGNSSSHGRGIGLRRADGGSRAGLPTATPCFRPADEPTSNARGRLAIHGDQRHALQDLGHRTETAADFRGAITPTSLKRDASSGCNRGGFIGHCHRRHAQQTGEVAADRAHVAERSGVQRRRRRAHKQTQPPEHRSGGHHGPDHER